jgi:hypothetical protein
MVTFHINIYKIVTRGQKKPHKVMISACFIVTISIEFELLKYY